MLVVCVFSCWGLMLIRTGMSLPPQAAEMDRLPGQKQAPATDHPRTGNRRWPNLGTHSTQNGHALGIRATGEGTLDATVSHRYPGNASCSHGEILEEVFMWLRERGGNESDVRSDDLTRFGVCSTNSDASPLATAALSELTGAANREAGGGVGVLHPTKELVADEEEEGRLTLTLDPPQSPLLKLKPILLLAFGSPLRARNVGITFTSHFLNPNTQTACVSEGTQYMALTGKAAEDNSHEKWRLSVETQTPNAGQMIQEILGEESGSNISMTPLLLFLSERGTDVVRSTQVPGSSLASSETSCFLCELQKFLGDVLPQSVPQSTPVRLDSLHSLPPLPLGLTSSETLLVGLLNSSGPTLFSFPAQSSVLQAHRGELSLPPVLQEVLRLKLEETMSQIREQEVGYRGMERLMRLKVFATLPTKQEDPLGGNTREIQYQAFLLLKALETVAQGFDFERGQRAARDQEGQGRGLQCRLHSLSVSLERYLLDPDTANIKNCHGICRYPLVNPTNHAILLNSHMENGTALERSLCCVPVDYEDLRVVELKEKGTTISMKPNMVAKECGCR